MGDYTYNEDIAIFKGFLSNDDGSMTLLFACKAEISVGTYGLLYVNGDGRVNTRDLAVTCAVLGCDNEAQLAANCALFEKTVTLTEEQEEKLREAFTGIDPRVINPGLWFNA